MLNRKWNPKLGTSSIWLLKSLWSPRDGVTTVPNVLVSKAVSYAISRGYQIDPDALRLIQELVQDKQQTHISPESIVALVIEEKARDSIGLTDVSTSITVFDLVEAHPDLFEDLQHTEVVSSVSNSPLILSRPNKSQYQREHESLIENIKPEIEVISELSKKIQPVGIEGFSHLFKSRYEKLVRILRERPEARQLSKITDLKEDKGGRFAGLVYSKKGMKNGVELTIDDESGRFSVYALSDEMKKAVNDVALDQCVMVEVEGKNGRYTLKNLTQPDLPNRVVSPSKKRVYGVFLSDLHVGSNRFLDTAFDRFLDWLCGKGPQMKEDEEIIKRLKYVVIGGDIVDGVGVFPNQESELSESNVYRQYEMVSKKLASIPRNLSVLVIPGNHDSTRQALPQPVIPRKYAQSLYDLENVTMLGDPSFVKLSGVSVLVYHGRSLDDVLATTPGLSYQRPAEAMKVLLRARHLAPMFGSRTPIAPELEDYLVIDQVPDIFHAGHVHSVGIESYRGTVIINSGTWQGQTGYQANLGIMPQPGLVPIVNLATLEVFTREFLTTYEPIITQVGS